MTKAILTINLLFCLFSTQFIAAQTAPDFTFTDTEGITHTLSERLDDGYIIVLDFFFIEDCPSCEEAGFELEAIHNDYEGQNVEVWAISPYDSVVSIEEFKEAHDFTFRMCGLEGGSWDIAEIFIDSLELYYFPTVSVICPSGDLEWDIWPYTSGGAPEWRAHIDDCGVHDINITSSLEDEVGLSATNLFPNPVQDILNIEFFTEDASDIRVEMFDFMGRKILEDTVLLSAAGAQTHQITARNFVSGNYILRLSNSIQTIGVSSFQK